MRFKGFVSEPHWGLYTKAAKNLTREHGFRALDFAAAPLNDGMWPRLSIPCWAASAKPPPHSPMPGAAATSNCGMVRPHSGRRAYAGCDGHAWPREESLRDLVCPSASMDQQVKLASWKPATENGPQRSQQL